MVGEVGTAAGTIMVVVGASDPSLVSASPPDTILGGDPEHLLWNFTGLRAAAGRPRPGGHLRRHGRHQYGARRNGDAGSVYDIRRSCAECFVNRLAHPVVDADVFECSAS